MSVHDEIERYIGVGLKLGLLIFILFQFDDVNNWLKGMFISLAVVMVMFKNLDFIEVFRFVRAGTRPQQKDTQSVRTPEPEVLKYESSGK